MEQLRLYSNNTDLGFALPSLKSYYRWRQNKIYVFNGSNEENSSFVGVAIMRVALCCYSNFTHYKYVVVETLRYMYQLFHVLHETPGPGSTVQVL